jgi:hypothetical protein
VPDQTSQADESAQGLIVAAERVAAGDPAEQDRWWAERSPQERATLRAIWDNTLQLRDLGEHGYPIITRLVTIDHSRPSLGDCSSALREMLNRVCSRPG